MHASVRHAEGNSAFGVACSGLIDRGVSDWSAQRISAFLRQSMGPKRRLALCRYGSARRLAVAKEFRRLARAPAPSAHSVRCFCSTRVSNRHPATDKLTECRRQPHRGKATSKSAIQHLPGVVLQQGQERPMDSSRGAASNSGPYPPRPAYVTERESAGASAIREMGVVDCYRGRIGYTATTTTIG